LLDGADLEIGHHGEVVSVGSEDLVLPVPPAPPVEPVRQPAHCAPRRRGRPAAS